MTITEEIAQALHIAKAIAKENSHPTFGPAHLLRALLHKDIGLVQQLESWGEDIYFIEEWAEVRIESMPKGKACSDPKGDENISQVFAEAENFALSLGMDQPDALCLLAALSTPGVGFSYEQLKTFPLQQHSILEKASRQENLAQLLNSALPAPHLSSKEVATGSLLQYCHELVEESLSGKSEAFVGREQELISITEILCRKSKPNIMISGEAGVGKTALIRGLAAAIVAGSIPARLKNARIFALDLNALLAGISYKGEAEDRFNKVVQALSQRDGNILFIDDIHQLFDKSLGLQGIINILKAALSKKRFVLIGTTLTDEYRKKLEPEGSLMRWCELMQIAEPSEEAAFRMLGGMLPAYSKHHQVAVNEQVLREVVRLSKRYIKESHLPDAALDVLDRSMAALQFMHHMAPQLASSFAQSLEALKNSQASSEDYEALYQQLLGSLNYLSLSYLDIDQREALPETPDARLLEGIITKLHLLGTDAPVQAEIAHVAATISKMCGIPAGKILSGERERLIGMEAQLQSKVIGQNGAIKVLADAILESRSGLARPGQPIGSFFLLGPTGTGKTELAKQLADFMFQSSSALIRFDMSEFKEEHAAALLYGAPPGYVGYEEGGLLVNKIRQQPYAVVLFDEIEKAHSSVFDIFLQILDEGKIHDKLGRVGDFSNAIVLFTSNIGSQVIVESFNKSGELPAQNALSSIMARYFRPEFLGRLSGIVPFAPIQKDNVIKILKLQLAELQQLLTAQGISLQVSEKAADKLATEGYSPDYGARPLRGLIRSWLKTPLSRMLISGQVQAGNVVVADVNETGEISLGCAQN